MPNESKPMNTKELSEAVSLLLEREQRRDARRRRKQRHNVIRRRREMDSGIQKLRQSIEVIKWCIVGITTVMVLSLLIVILVIMEVEREAERIKGEVQEIKREAEIIRDKIRHPMQTIGGALGSQLDQKLGSFLEADADK